MEGGKRLAEIPETLLKRRKARRDAEAKEAAAAIRQRKVLTEFCDTENGPFSLAFLLRSDKA